MTLTKKQREESPSIDTDKPVSRQHEASYLDYYGYPYYWIGPYLWGPITYPRLSGVAQKRNEEVRALRKEANDLHLRSVSQVTGHHIEATDGHIGHAEDFIIDGETWEIGYMVVDTKNWWPGKKVLVAPLWVSRVSWSDFTVYVDLSREMIKIDLNIIQKHSTGNMKRRFTITTNGRSIGTFESKTHFWT